MDTPAGQVQLYVEPGHDVPVYVTVALLLLQTGLGFTVNEDVGLGRMVKTRFIGVPVQPFKLGVMV
jgi:hypothetical protein